MYLDIIASYYCTIICLKCRKKFIVKTSTDETDWACEEVGRFVRQDSTGVYEKCPKCKTLYQINFSTRTFLLIEEKKEMSSRTTILNKAIRAVASVIRHAIKIHKKSNK